MLFFVQTSFSQKKDTTFLKPKTIPAKLSILTPPNGFVASDQFNGYINVNQGSVILLTMIENVSYPILEKSMTVAAFERNNVVLIKKSKIKTDSQLGGVSYKFAYKVKETELIRYMFYVGNLNKTLWVNVSYPKMIDSLIEKEILKSIQSIKFESK